PLLPPKMAKPGCGCIAALSVASASVQWGDVADQVPEPPPSCDAVAAPLAFQKFNSSPLALSTLMLLPSTCSWSISPAGTEPSTRPPLDWLREPPHDRILYSPAPMPASSTLSV